MTRTVIGALTTGALLVGLAMPAHAANREHQQLMADIRMLQEQSQQLQLVLASLADTLKALDGVTQEMVDWYPDAPLNSIGTLLYHTALIEAAWVVEEILERDDEPLEDWQR